MERTQARELLTQYNKESFFWGIVGLLHDLDSVLSKKKTLTTTTYPLHGNQMIHRQ
jgi:predicted hydrolase (HD superfamily)